MFLRVKSMEVLGSTLCIKQKCMHAQKKLLKPNSGDKKKLLMSYPIWLVNGIY